MSRPAKISPLRVTSIEEAQRAIDQLTQKINELAERSTNVVNDKGKSETQGTSVRIKKTFDPDSKLVIPHKLGRPYTGWRSLNGVQFTELPNQSNKSAQLELIMVPWVYPHPTSVLSATAQDIEVTGLRGDLELAYRLTCEYNEGSGGGATAELYINGVIPEFRETQRVQHNGGSLGAVSRDSVLLKDSVNGNIGRFFVEIEAKARTTSGRHPILINTTFGDGTAPSSLYALHAGAVWAVTGNPEITSLSVHANIANGLAPATKLQVIAKAPQTRDAIIEVY